MRTRRAFLAGLGLGITGIRPAAAGKIQERTCEQNLRAIYDAVMAYKARWNRFPATLSTLVEDGFIDSRLLLCPVLRAKGVNTASNRLLQDNSGADYMTLYIWEYGPGSQSAERHEVQRKMGAGDWVPLVRCREHAHELEGGHNHLNLSLGGGIYSSGVLWELQLRNRIPFPYLSALVFLEEWDGIPLRDRIPARSPNSTVRQIDLSTAFNGSLTDPWSEGWEGEDAPELAALGGDRRTWEIDDVEFELRGVCQLEGRAAAIAYHDKKIREPRFPYETHAIELSLETTKLHVLCGVIGDLTDGVAAGKLRLTTAGGEKIFVLEHGRHVADGRALTLPSSSSIAWSRDRPINRKKELLEKVKLAALTSVSHVVWDLGGSHKITSIKFESADTACYPLLLAITAE